MFILINKLKLGRMKKLFKSIYVFALFVEHKSIPIDYIEECTWLWFEKQKLVNYNQRASALRFNQREKTIQQATFATLIY